jgi:hypothetical protein
MEQRPSTLDGVVVGLVNNSKANGPALFSVIGRLLQERFAIKEIVGPIRTENVYFPSEQARRYDERQLIELLMLVGQCHLVAF